MLVVYDVNDIHRNYPWKKTCTQCNGSGRVVVYGEIIKQVDAYEPAEPV